MNPERLIESF